MVTTVRHPQHTDVADNISLGMEELAFGKKSLICDYERTISLSSTMQRSWVLGS